MSSLPQDVQSTLRRDGKMHTNCFSCYSKTRDADASSIVNPTPVKIAQVVLLAANVDYNVTQPVLPNLPKYDTDRLNKYCPRTTL